MADEMMSIGEYLRQSRQSRRLEIADISQELHIRPEYLQALEHDQWDKLPGEVYALGFLRSYARYLGVDAEALVDYRRRLSARESPLRPASPAPVEPTAALLSRRQRKRRRQRPPTGQATTPWRPRRTASASEGPSGSGWVVFGAAAVLVALFVAGMWALNHQTKGTVVGGSARPRQSPSASASKRAHKKGTTPSSSPSPSKPLVNVALTSNNPANGDLVYRVSGGPLHVNLTFTGQCWVEVWQNGVTKNPYGVTYNAGQTLSVSASSSLELFVGTRAFHLAVDNQAISLPDPGDHVFHMTFNHS